ncbi:MAG TPA: SDR family oxidoreductase [Rhodocyclaceae bacterium]|nr:SDR family oxidoreductase [Rhodocyclaceae bacterium]
MQRLLIVGAGDVARRTLPLLLGRYRLYALVRSAERAAAWRASGVTPILADLDDRRSLSRIAGLADLVLHFAPPPNQGVRDARTQALLAALGRGKSLARRLIYVSTTGVYGDCAGAVIDETRRLNPESPRAARRADAEQRLRAASLPTLILRAPGIYATDRLPLERLKAGTPALRAEEDVFTNHIHADDLAAACVRALTRGGNKRCINVVDDSDLQMAAYFDLVADHFKLPRPPRVNRAELARQLSPMQISFMRESRRISNRRMKSELGLRLRYPTVAATLSGIPVP